MPLTKEFMQRVNSKPSLTKRILIADDHKIMRQGLRALLIKDRRFECVGEVDDAQGALKLARELRPDIVIIVIVTPNLNGVESTRQIKTEFPEIEVVVLSIDATPDYVAQVLEAGATAFLLKDAAFEELATALLAVSKGKMYLSPAIAKVGRIGTEIEGISGKIVRGHRLTKRELQVLKLIAEGASTKEIAAGLSLSVKTIETHRKQIMDKLGIRSVAGLTRYCIREGLIAL